MRTKLYMLIVVAVAVSGLFTTGVLGDLLGGETRAKLQGTWVWDEGEGVSRAVTTYSFSGDGTFTRKFERPAGMQENENKAISGVWRLETVDKGLKSLIQDPSKLVLEYKSAEAGLSASAVITETYLVAISNDQMFGGKETLRLIPPDGSLAGTQYFFRAQ